MQNKYIVFDVETPNAANNRISAIGITVVENGKISEDFYYLVNPEVPFDYFNISLTGITPSLVADKPAFPELWNMIEPIMGSGLLIAHNAPFDMSVLAKCLCHYHISWQPYTYYACTCSMGRACLPELPNHKLNTMCDYFDIDLDHHNAGSDSRACAQLLMLYMDNGIDTDNFIRNYDLARMCTIQERRKIKPSAESTKLLELKSLLGEIAEDGILSESEIFKLQNWLNNNIKLKGNFPFDKIFDTVGQALNDGVLEDCELAALLELFKQITDPVTNACTCEFNMEGKTFCLSGEFEYGDKATVQEKLSETGGIPVNGVTKNTDYVIVGSKGNNAWCAGNYGTKVKKALEMKEKGIPG